MILPLFFLILASGKIEAAKECPPPENLSPNCICQPQGGVYLLITCNNIRHPKDLIPAIQASKGIDLLSMSIEGSSLEYIPSDIFENTNFSKISLENTQLMALSESDVAFKGLEDHLEEIRATGPFYNATWEWSQLKNLKRIDLIDFNNIGMHAICNAFPHLQTLKALGMSNANIEYIHPTAFSKLPNLFLLVLKKNKISEMKRSMLPIPAKDLFHLDLSDNVLVTVPYNMFEQMPNLEEVLLHNNKFVTLNQNTFSEILDKLQTFNIDGNKIRCDCQLKWIVDQKWPIIGFGGKCHEPERLQGKLLTKLEKDDLLC